MNLDDVLDSVNKVINLSEQYFVELGDLFPSLLNREGSTSLQNLQTVLNELYEGNEKSNHLEAELFSDYAEKYNPLFEELNNKISTLSELDKMIAGIKEDSEQMELIALNAMVISIKSGERGQAFSRITENLQRLSNDMFIFSDKLLEEEKQLIEHINELQKIFKNIMESQKKVSQQGSNSSQAVSSLISGVLGPLGQMEQNINSVYPPIQKAMTTLQLQDIVRQSLEGIKNCLLKIKNTDLLVAGSDDQLDSIELNRKIFEVCNEILDYIINQITNSFLEFDQNWSEVTTLLEDVESEKQNFSSRFLSDISISGENINTRLAQISGDFEKLMSEFSNYHLVQKDLLHTTQSITEKARTMYSVFGNLRPVMSRLHHVRILQQIEVSKNEAIKSVKDSVTDMDNLINSANNSLDIMETLLSQFITDTKNLLTNFTVSISKDNDNMLILRKEKGQYFDELKAAQNRLAAIISNFAVFPMGFEDKYRRVASDLSGISALNVELKEYRNHLNQIVSDLETKEKDLLASRGMITWQIKNPEYQELIEQLTISARKGATGEFSGGTENTSSAGDITFF
ncbi:MAG TPA: hypothetical protein DCF70_09305 [Treponema sp.]|nr:hypothetical protein [Treponema sp.]